MNETQNTILVMINLSLSIIMFVMTLIIIAPMFGVVGFVIGTILAFIIAIHGTTQFWNQSVEDVTVSLECD